MRRATGWRPARDQAADLEDDRNAGQFPDPSTLVDILRGSDERIVSALKKAAAEVSASETDFRSTCGARCERLARDRQKRFELESQQYAVGNLVVSVGGRQPLVLAVWAVGLLWRWWALSATNAATSSAAG